MASQQQQQQQQCAETLVSMGGPLFRKPGTTHEDFSFAWHRHARVVVPWFLEFGIVEYVQIHLPRPADTEKATLGATTAFQDDGEAAERLLQKADGVALVRCKVVPSVEGRARPFGDGLTHPYLEKVVAVDERRFLHEEFGAGAVRREPPSFEVPDLSADAWRGLAVRIGGVEHVKIMGARELIQDAWWDEWEKIELGLDSR